MIELYQLIDKLEKEHSLTLDEYQLLVENESKALFVYASNKAKKLAQSIYATDIYVRGLIEVGNYCRNDCFYCGIRKSNTHADRYILNEEDILSCCREGYELGFRTFVLQSGEVFYFNDDRLCEIISSIHKTYPDCAITLSIGERSKDSYQRLFDAGANRYLLRHETANPLHYKKLHPKEMSFDQRMQCLHDLREIGFDVGVGMMVGSPYQTSMDLAMDLKFIESFHPEMCGIGPYIPSSQTPFKDFHAGSVDLTCFLLSVIRLIQPNILLQATTALGTMDPKGREKGVLAGANVVMPNLSPISVRRKYQLYDNKICIGDESAQCRHCLEKRMESIQYHVVTDIGQIKPWKEGESV